MKFKYKAGFIAIVALIDLMVIVLVVLNNGKTNIKNDVNNKTAAHVLDNKGKSKQEEKKEENIEEVVDETEEVTESKPEDVVQNLEVLVDNDVTEENIKEDVVEEKPAIVYENMTLDELSEKLNRSLNSTISGKGYLIASYSLELGVDPYLATGIILLETGCSWECSSLVKECNNVGGQKGSGCGSYTAYDTLDDGIKGFIDNLYRNYYSYGLTTPEQMNSKYASSTEWATKVNNYIDKIKAS